MPASARFATARSRRLLASSSVEVVQAVQDTFARENTGDGLWNPRCTRRAPNDYLDNTGNCVETWGTGVAGEKEGRDLPTRAPHRVPRSLPLLTSPLPRLHSL